MDQEKIGKFIANLRKEKNLTQEQLAAKLSISKNAVSKWERGICLMDMSLLKPLSEILDVSINEILNGEKISNKDFKEKADEVLTNTIKYSNKRISKIKKIIIICIVTFVSLLFITTFSIDYIRVNKNLEPLFMVRISEKGNKYTYLGFGYKMIKDVAISPYEPLDHSISIKFGLWIYAWNVKVFNLRPRNLWVIDNDNRVLTEIGSYCITDTKGKDKASTCADADLSLIKYDKILNANSEDVINIDINDSLTITRVSIYDLNFNKLDISINNSDNHFKLPDIKGNYIILLDTISERGTAWYSFRIDIK